MATFNDDLSIALYDGQAILEIVNDATTAVNIRTELRGAAIQVSGAVCTLIRTDTSTVTITATAPVAGEVNTSISSANLTTIGATIGDDLVLTLTGTVTDGSATVPFRRQFTATVVSRVALIAISYDELTGRYAQLSRSSSLPTSQTTFSPQMRIGLRSYRRELHIRFGRENDLPFPDALAPLQVAYVLEAVCVFCLSQQNGRSDFWPDQITFWRAEQTRLWTRLEVLVETHRKSFGTVPNTTVRRLEGESYRNPRPDGPVSYGGSM